MILWIALILSYNLCSLPESKLFSAENFEGFHAEKQRLKEHSKYFSLIHKHAHAHIAKDSISRCCLKSFLYYYLGKECSCTVVVGMHEEFWTDPKAFLESNTLKCKMLILSVLINKKYQLYVTIITTSSMSRTILDSEPFLTANVTKCMFKRKSLCLPFSVTY